MAKGILKKIFQDHRESFKEIYGHQMRKTVDKEVNKMINCGSLENGYSEYKCNNCGEEKRVGFSGKVYIDDRAENMTEKLVRTKHRHMVFTIPQELRIYFRKHRKMLSVLPQCAAEIIKSWYLERNKEERFTPFHMLVTEGAAGEVTPWSRFFGI